MNDETIYIGKTKNLDRRISEHMRDKTWIREVKSIEYATLNSQEDMDLLERLLIKKLNPKYNERLAPKTEITLELPRNIKFLKFQNFEPYSKYEQVLEQGYIVKSNKFVNSIFKLDEYIERILEYTLSKINSIDDYKCSDNYFNIKDFRRDYNLTGGDAYELIYEKVSIKDNFTVKSLNNEFKDFNIFESIEAKNGVVDYKFSETFIKINTDFTDGFVKMEFEPLSKIRNWRLKRMYELMLSKKVVGRWKVKLEDMQALMCNDYDNYGDFNRHIINKNIKELKRLFDMEIVNNRVDRGNKAVGFEFIIS